jgi:hypothetical protein
LSLVDVLASGRLDPSHIGLLRWTARPLWRIYSPTFGPADFNATSRGNSRFSPIEYGGAIVPTLYAGTTVEVALMETVLHDAPAHSAGFVLTLDARTERRRVAQLLPVADLQFADLSTLGLRRLGLTRADVIDCDKSGYPATRQLAHWVYASCPGAQGIVWTSRQDDNGQAIILFEPRLAPVTLDLLQVDEPFTTGSHHAALVNLAERLGAALIVER